MIIFVVLIMSNTNITGRQCFNYNFKSFSNFPFRVVWIRNKESVLKAGFVVGTKYFKKAVQRNKIKRLMREAYRLQKNILQDHLGANNSGLSIIILYSGKEIPPYELVYEKMKTILNRLIKLTDENDQVHT